MTSPEMTAPTARKSPYRFPKLRTAGVFLTHAVFVGLLALVFLRSDSEQRSYAAEASRKKTPTSAARPRKGTEPSVAAPSEPPVTRPATNAEPPPSASTEQTPAVQSPDIPATNAPASNAKIRNARLLDRLVKAYPDFLASHDGQSVLWRDGERMRFDDGREKTSGERLELPDLEDSFFDDYPAGREAANPPPDFDPGRSIFEPFFTKMYGDCKAGDVEKRLASVVWLPKNWGKTIRATTVNGVDKRLTQISAELDELPPDLIKYLKPTSDDYSCRPIAGTARLGMHAYAAAIDLNPAFGDNWQNVRRSRRQYRYRNRIPLEIVEIFEKHGFIWGGRWSHFDTPHFEYRPELLPEFSSMAPATSAPVSQTPPEPSQAAVAPQPPVNPPTNLESLPLPTRQPRNIQ